jgi:hypothetical protein
MECSILPNAEPACRALTGRHCRFESRWNHSMPFAVPSPSTTEQRLIETKGSEKWYRKIEAWSLTQKSRFPAGTSCRRNQAPFTLGISRAAARGDKKSLTVLSHIGETRATRQHRSPGKQKAGALIPAFSGHNRRRRSSIAAV